MDISTIGIIGGIIVIVVVFFAFKNKRDATQIMQGNENVVPLMLQKSTQIKVNRLLQATQDIPKANEQLQKLIASYKNNQISIQDYNLKLDNIISHLEIDL